MVEPRLLGLISSLSLFDVCAIVCIFIFDDLMPINQTIVSLVTIFYASSSTKRLVKKPVVGLDYIIHHYIIHCMVENNECIICTAYCDSQFVS